MEKQKIIFFTGAGISVESGIPTFQEQPGIRTKLTRSFADSNPEEYRETIRGMMEVCEKAQPNAADRVPVICNNRKHIYGWK